MSLVPLHLDLAAGPARVRARDLVVLVLGSAALVAAVQWAGRTSARRDALQSQIETLDQQAHARRDRTAARRADPKDAHREKAVADMQRELALPWQRLLGAVEDAQDKDVALLLVEPTAASRTVRLHLEARHRQAMLDHLDRLQSDRRLADVVMLTHQDHVEAGVRSVRFQLQATWGSEP